MRALCGALNAIYILADGELRVNKSEWARKRHGICSTIVSEIEWMTDDKHLCEEAEHVDIPAQRAAAVELFDHAS
jgi:hypothetical protein